MREITGHSGRAPLPEKGQWMSISTSLNQMESISLVPPCIPPNCQHSRLFTRLFNSVMVMSWKVLCGQITAEQLTRPPGRNKFGWRSETNQTFPGSILLLTTGNIPFVLDVRQGLPSDFATKLNWKGPMLPSRFSEGNTLSSFSFIFVCKQLL